ncbi:3-hydroxyacyl-CoA dehydrogenase [Labrys monachus]|uniref:3-hydroxyacyl-CoA dehydrogenase n=1 Tax=Labrys monachus TaxID=217067 RepID=A0ABU0FHJ8_9HYPH|nr:3-hydroxyacyl-CoA dehydrogenase [Labrys monachus]MDQ0393961.1 3-hydroxyacyl-CoA dehydrogenase [Labrys monachus]
MATIAIIGSGFIGRAWAISFARAGHRVRLWDAAADAPQAALDYIAGILPDLAANDLLEGATPDALMARITPAATLAEAVGEADHVQENAPEVLETKRALFAELDALAPPATALASSTSALLPSAFTDHLAGRARCLVVHPINPPYLVPAAEVVPSPWTDPAVIERTAALLRSAGHAPIVMKREIDGFLMNRLQGALLEEAFRLVADGVATVEDVDIGIRDGLALRWSFMGPFETIDLNAPGGVRDYVVRYQGIYERIFPSTQRRADWAGPVLETVEGERRARLPASDLPKRQAWRDRMLMALASHKRRVRTDIGS